ncbi:MAG: DUF4956 domain-containing protein [Saprospiraceae bacterium]|nr:DUF4956 domain-containing protein [Saprospiraceae bacterium]
MIDFSLQDINTDHPSLWSVTYVLLMAFALSSVLALVYQLTTPRSPRTGQFIQTMILGSLGAAIIVLAIGDSLGRGLGILGALAIIRFRTTLRQQRDIVFIFCTLGIGMACGMYGFNIAVIGAALFSVLALVFRFTSLNALPELRQQLRINYPLEANINQQQIEQVLKKYTHQFKLIRKEISQDAKLKSVELIFLFTKPLMAETDLLNDLGQLHDQLNFRMWSRSENEND